MGSATEARKVARALLGEEFPRKRPGEDADGIDRVASAASRADRRPCGISCDACGMEFEIGYRPDPCIGGYLPDVSHACCRHGREWRAYVTLGGVPDQSATTIPDHRVLRGRSALAYIDEHRHLAVTDP